MKRIIQIALFFVFILGMSNVAQSQAKFGHIDTNQLLSMMPGRDAAEQELRDYARELESQFVAMQNEFQTKYQEYLEKQGTYSELIRQSRERELGSLQERIMEFQESAQEDLMNRENRLLQPIINEARTAIEEVAKENGYTYIFDLSGGSILYAEPTEDIMEKVKAKLGITQ